MNHLTVTKYYYQFVWMFFIRFKINYNNLSYLIKYIMNSMLLVELLNKSNIIIMFSFINLRISIFNFAHHVLSMIIYADIIIIILFQVVRRLLITFYKFFFIIHF